MTLHYSSAQSATADAEDVEYTAAGAARIERPHPPVLTTIALALAAGLSVFGVLAPELFMQVILSLNTSFMDAAADKVLLVSSLLLVVCAIIAISPLGRLRLGQESDRPEFSTVSWLAMLFATGMGSGLLYWGVAEPIVHFSQPPQGNEALAALGEARQAMAISYLHWTLHPWGIYAAGGLVIAYFGFRSEQGLLPSAPFRELLPRRWRMADTVGDVVDITCIIALLLGLSAALASGTMQIGSGTRWLGNPASETAMFPTYLITIVLLCITYLLSAVTPLGNGIRRLSELNMLLAVLLVGLLCFFFSLGNTLAVLSRSLTDYLAFLPELSLEVLGGNDQPQWSGTWTANYFLSWMAWVPLVGVFIARISRGRTIRSFLAGVILVPSLFTVLWFSILGGLALEVQQSGMLDLAAEVTSDAGSGLFALLSLLPGAELFWMLAVVLLFIFLVTSADSASYVLAMAAGRGMETPPVNSRIFWGLAIAVLTGVTLFSEGGIHSVRAVFSFAGITVLFVLIGQMLCLLWALLGREARSQH